VGRGQEEQDQGQCPGGFRWKTQNRNIFGSVEWAENKTQKRNLSSTIDLVFTKLHIICKDVAV
jgi:hypothetical protein